MWTDVFFIITVPEGHRLHGQKDIQYYEGTCYVHEEYDAEQIFKIRTEFPDAKVISHPECNAEIVANSDYVGSTGQLLDYMKQPLLKTII